MKNIAILIILIAALSFAPLSWAKTLTLYEEPKDTAKIAGTIDTDAGIIPIFSPEKSTWMKVADPHNGNVGWIKMSDLSGEKTSEYTFTQRIINTGSSPQNYQVIQFGAPNKMTSAQVQDLLKKQQSDQQILQNNMNKSIQKMVDDMRNLYKWNSNWNSHNLPFVMPVIVIPAQNTTEKPADKK